MKCQICGGFYDPDNQSPVCPHVRLDPPLARLGGPRLRPEIQSQIDEAFAMKNVYALTSWLGSANFAAKYYAQDKINRLKAEEEGHGESFISELQGPSGNES
jgi:hypothetical protein